MGGVQDPVGAAWGNDLDRIYVSMCHCPHHDGCFPPGARAHSFGCAWYCFALAPPFGAQNLVMSKTRAMDTNALSGTRD